MFFTGPWEYNNFKEAGISFGVMPFAGEKAESNYLVGGPAASWGINVNTDNKEGAIVRESIRDFHRNMKMLWMRWKKEELHAVGTDGV